MFDTLYVTDVDVRFFRGNVEITDARQGRILENTCNFYIFPKIPIQEKHFCRKFGSITLWIRSYVSWAGSKNKFTRMFIRVFDSSDREILQ